MSVFSLYSLRELDHFCINCRGLSWTMGEDDGIE